MTARRARLLAVFPLLLFFIPAHAAVLAAFDFDTSDGGFELEPENLHEALLSARVADSAGTLDDFSGVTGRALAARAFPAGNAVGFTFEARPHKRFQARRFGFAARVSATGPTVLEIAFAGHEIGRIETTTGFVFHDIYLPAAAPAAEAELVLFGLGASSNAGTLRLDDVVLHGEVHAVPLPPAAGLMLAGLAVLGSGVARGITRRCRPTRARRRPAGNTSRA